MSVAKVGSFLLAILGIVYLSDIGSGLLRAPEVVSEIAAEVSRLEDTATWDWIDVADLPSARIVQHSTRTRDGMVLIAGGAMLPSYDEFSSTELYDPVRDMWLPAVELPRPAPDSSLVDLNLVTDRNGTIIAVAYMSFSASTDRSTHLYYFSDDHDWLAIDMPPLALEVFGTTASLPYMAISSPDILITVGGAYSSGGQNIRVIDTVLEYDIKSSLWKNRKPLLQRRRDSAGAVMADGRLLVTAGLELEVIEGFPDPETYSRYLVSSEIYDVATDEWTTASDTLHTRRFASTFRLSDGRILAFGGHRAAFVDLYDPATDSWRSVGSTSGGGHGLEFVESSQGEILVAGGEDNQLDVFQSVIEEWSSIELPEGMESDETITEIEMDRYLVTGSGSTSAAILQRTGIHKPALIPFAVRRKR